MAAPPPIAPSPRRNWAPWFEALDLLMDRHGYRLLEAVEWLVDHDEALTDDRAEREAANPGKTWAQVSGEFSGFYQAMARHRRSLKQARERNHDDKSDDAGAAG